MPNKHTIFVLHYFGNQKKAKYVSDNPKVNQMKKIQIFGVGCAKYRTLLENLHEALAKAKINVKVEEFDDIQLFFDKKISAVPSLFIDQHIVVEGIAPSVEELVAILERYISESNKQK
jgi:predicted thioredoxin/glutaredoxin